VAGEARLKDAVTITIERSAVQVAVLQVRNWAAWNAAHKVGPHGHRWLDTDAPKTNREWGERKIAKAMEDIRIARENPTKASEENLPFGSFAWRERLAGGVDKMKMKSWDKFDHRAFRAQSGNSRIRANLVKEQAARAEAKGVEGVRPEVRAGMEEGLRRLAADPRIEHLAHALGIKVKIDTQINPDREPGRMESDRWAKATTEIFHSRVGDPFVIHLNDYAADKGMDLGMDDTNPGFDVQERMGAGATVGTGWHATITHEFGHVVEGALMEKNDPRVAQWRQLWNSYKDNGDKKLASLEHPSAEWDNEFRNRVSYYSMENEKEGFAETFTAVMAPGYDRAAYPPAAQPLLDFMEGLVSST
jgi:hypothetical protein